MTVQRPQSRSLYPKKEFKEFKDSLFSSFFPLRSSFFLLQISLPTAYLRSRPLQ